MTVFINHTTGVCYRETLAGWLPISLAEAKRLLLAGYKEAGECRKH